MARGLEPSHSVTDTFHTLLPAAWMTPIPLSIDRVPLDMSLQDKSTWHSQKVGGRKPARTDDVKNKPAGQTSTEHPTTAQTSGRAMSVESGMYGPEIASCRHAADGRNR